MSDFLMNVKSSNMLGAMSSKRRQARKGVVGVHGEAVLPNKQFPGEKMCCHQPDEFWPLPYGTVGGKGGNGVTDVTTTVLQKTGAILPPSPCPSPTRGEGTLIAKTALNLPHGLQSKWCFDIKKGRFSRLRHAEDWG